MIESVTVWLFAGPTTCALSHDDHDTRLPNELGPWRRVRSVTLTGERPDELEAIALINKHGFCCFEP